MMGMRWFCDFAEREFIGAAPEIVVTVGLGQARLQETGALPDFLCESGENSGLSRKRTDRPPVRLISHGLQ
jgi:hypothetical protein